MPSMVRHYLLWRQGAWISDSGPNLSTPGLRWRSDAGEPVVFLGDSETGKSHLLIGMGVAACEEGRPVRDVTCAALVNELAEAAEEHPPVGRTPALRW